MKNTRMGRRTPRSLVGPAAFLAAGAVGLWLWLARGDGPALLGAEALFIGAPLLAVAAYWWWRGRAARRWSAAVNAYAERELARARRAALPTRAAAVAAPARDLNNHRRPA